MPFASPRGKKEGEMEGVLWMKKMKKKKKKNLNKTGVEAVVVVQQRRNECVRV